MLHVVVHRESNGGGGDDLHRSSMGEGEVKDLGGQPAHAKARPQTGAGPRQREPGRFAQGGQTPCPSMLGKRTASAMEYCPNTGLMVGSRMT